MAEAKVRNRKVLMGTVTSDKMDKTIVVRIDIKKRHPIYSKLIKTAVRYKAHDEKNAAKIGDTVKIVGSRPLSKEKRWRLLEVVPPKQ